MTYLTMLLALTPLLIIFGFFRRQFSAILNPLNLRMSPSRTMIAVESTVMVMIIDQSDRRESDDAEERDDATTHAASTGVQDPFREHCDNMKISETNSSVNVRGCVMINVVMHLTFIRGCVQDKVFSAVISHQRSEMC